MENPQIICFGEKSINFSIYDAKWVPVSAKFVVLGSKPRGTGVIHVYEIVQSQLQLISDIEKPKAIKCGTFAASSLAERQIATGDFDGRLQVFDLKDMNSAVYTATGHKDLINCIDGVGGSCVGSGAPEIVTGGRDGVVNVWDLRQKERPVTVIAPAEGDPRRDCW